MCAMLTFLQRCLSWDDLFHVVLVQAGRARSAHCVLYVQLNSRRGFWRASHEKTSGKIFKQLTKCVRAIAYGVGHMNDAGGLEAWRWLFLIEGIPSGKSPLVLCLEILVKLTDCVSHHGSACLFPPAQLSGKSQIPHRSREEDATPPSFRWK